MNYELFVSRSAVTLQCSGLLYSFEARDNAFFEDLLDNSNHLAVCFASAFKTIDDEHLVFVIDEIGVLKISNSEAILVQNEKSDYLREYKLTIDTSIPLYLQSVQIRNLHSLSPITYVQMGKRATVIWNFTVRDVINEGMLVCNKMIAKDIVNHAMLRIEEEDVQIEVVSIVNESVPGSLVKAVISGEEVSIKISDSLVNKSEIEISSLEIEGSGSGSVKFINDGVVTTKSQTFHISIINNGTMTSAYTVFGEDVENTEFGFIKSDTLICSKKLTNTGDVSTVKGNFFSGENLSKITMTSLTLTSTFVNKKDASITGGRLIVINILSNYGKIKVDSLDTLRTRDVRTSYISNMVGGEIYTLHHSNNYNKFENYGYWENSGEGASITSNSFFYIKNDGELVWINTKVTVSAGSTGSTIYSKGKITLDNVSNKIAGKFSITNYDLLELKNSEIYFHSVVNHKNMFCHSGQYAVSCMFQTHSLLSFLDEKWLFTSKEAGGLGRNIMKINPEHLQLLGDIEAEGRLEINLPSAPNNIRACDLYIMDDCKFSMEGISTMNVERVRFMNKMVSIVKETCFNIVHAELEVDGYFNIRNNLKFHNLKLKVVGGNLNFGQNMSEFGTLTTTGTMNLHVVGEINIAYGQIYSQKALDIYVKKGGINMGHPSRGPYGDVYGSYEGDVLCTSFISSGDTMNVKSSFHINIPLSQFISKNDMTIKTSGSIYNRGGRICSEGGNVSLRGGVLTHQRTGSFRNGNRDSPSSGPAVIEALGDVSLNFIRIDNSASNFIGGKSITIVTAGSYKEAPLVLGMYKTRQYLQSPYDWIPRDYSGQFNKVYPWLVHNESYWDPNSTPYACVFQNGGETRINTGLCVLTCSMNSPNIEIVSKTADIRGTSFSSRRGTSYQSNNSSGKTSVVINLNEYVKNTIKGNAFYKDDGKAITTAFPFGDNTRPDSMLTINNNCFDNRPVYNPLSSLDINMWIQRSISQAIGKVWLTDNSNDNNIVSGRDLYPRLSQNALEWSETNGTNITEEQLATTSTAMILHKLLNVGNEVEKQTLIAIPAREVNTLTCAGDISGNSISIVTEDDQTYTGNRIVARDIIRLASTNGTVRRRTEKYTVDFQESDHSRLRYDVAGNEQQIICQGDIVVQGKNIDEVGVLTVAGNDITEEATQTISKKPLILNTTIERSWEESSGFFSTKRCTSIESVDTLQVCKTMAGGNLVERSNVIHLTGAKEVAKRIVYRADTLITNAAVGNYSSSYKSKTSGGFTKRSETYEVNGHVTEPCSITAEEIIIDSEKAIFKGTDFVASVLRDNTRDGMELKPEIITTTYFNQVTSKAPLASSDIGSKGWYEEMVPCRLIVSQVIRNIDNGCIKMESVVWDSKRTEIIGKFAETVYELKKFHEEWAIVKQVIPNEVIVIVALAITLCTGNIGVLAAAGEMMTVAFTAVCCHLATNLLRHGDITAACESMMSGNFLKSLAIDVATAGIANLGISKLPTSVTNFSNSGIYRRVLTSGLRATVRASISTIVGVKVNIKSMATDVIVNSIAGDIAEKISGMTGIEHKLAHFALGAATGAILDKDIKQGIITGGIGAVIGEVVAETLVDREAVSKEVLKEMMMKSQTKDNSYWFNFVEYDERYRKKLSFYANLGKLTAASVVTLLGYQPDTAVTTSTNSLENNFMSQIIVPSLEALLEVAKEKLPEVIADSGAEITSDEQEKIKKEHDKLWADITNPDSKGFTNFWDTVSEMAEKKYEYSLTAKKEERRKKKEQTPNDEYLPVRGIHATTDQPHQERYMMNRKTGQIISLGKGPIETGEYKYTTTKDTLVSIYQEFYMNGLEIATMSKTLELLHSGMPKITSGYIYRGEAALASLLPVWIEKTLSKVGTYANVVLSIIPNYLKQLIVLATYTADVSAKSVKRLMLDVGISPWLVQDTFDGVLYCSIVGKVIPAVSKLRVAANSNRSVKSNANRNVPNKDNVVPIAEEFKRQPKLDMRKTRMTEDDKRMTNEYFDKLMKEGERKRRFNIHNHQMPNSNVKPKGNVVPFPNKTGDISSSITSEKFLMGDALKYLNMKPANSNFQQFNH